MILPLIQNMKTLKNGKNLEVSTYKLLSVLASNRNQHANYCPVNNTNQLNIKIMFSLEFVHCFHQNQNGTSSLK